MILLLSGEGPSDIGTLNGQEFVPGVMTLLIDQLTEAQWGYSFLDGQSVEFVSKKDLIDMCKTKKKSAVLVGLKKGKGTAEFHKNAQALAILSKNLANKEGCAVGCVLFRDCDGVRASARTRWQEKWDSMEEGFKAQGFGFGVPMIPKPKSESWILCALQDSPHRDCDQLEDLPGNDSSSGAPKEVLAQKLLELGLGDSSTANLMRLVREGKIDVRQINMPSYNAFKNRLNSTLREMLRNA